MKSITLRIHPIVFLFSMSCMGFLIFFSGRMAQNESSSQLSTREYNVQAVLWFQSAGEARALQYQAYNIARWMLDKDLKEVKTFKRRAVVVDIDETILDNIIYEGTMIKINKGYPFEWDQWIDVAQAEAIHGSVEFLSYAASKGVDLFYVTNRKERDKKGTLENLKRSGFPQVDDSHLYFKTTESSKESRRLKIAETHRVVLLMGDNLTDFAGVFDKRSVQDRNAEVDRLKNEFGKRFIVLPNPVYGDWEDAIYGYQTGLSDSVKNLKRKDALKGY